MTLSRKAVLPSDPLSRARANLRAIDAFVPRSPFERDLQKSNRAQAAAFVAYLEGEEEDGA